ncbi:MAG: glycosyltransferase family 2 protein [Lachnospiraceae bacterium]|nr:glycosyltransferase family 2 protein [Lachnospiraceae bacterium]
MVRMCHVLRKVCYSIKFIKQDKVNRFCERMIRRYYSLVKRNASGLNQKKNRKRELIVSLTTIPSRIDSVYLTVESVLRQTYKPDKIILWLAKDEFRNAVLPDSLLEQRKRGLEIRYCDNLRSHKKYYETMKRFPEALLVTIDDDIYYSEHLLENLVHAYTHHPNAVVCSRAHLIKHKVTGEPYPYNGWIFYSKWCKFFSKVKESEHESLFFTSGAGTLIPIWKMPRICLDKKLSGILCPTADDVWLNYMVRLAKLKVMQLKSSDGWYVYREEAQNLSLSMVNLSRNGDNNDVQLTRMQKYFGFYI